MPERTLSYFVSDVHLGLCVNDASAREARFVQFLKDIPRDRTRSLFLLGDIWDFWYEYRDVVPREGIRVVAELISLMDAGVEVWFVPGNHDVWCYSFFESLGIRKHEQPLDVQIGSCSFLLGHGDCLGGAGFGERLVHAIFHCKALQRIFSTLHPWIAYRFGTSWSGGNRKSHKPYRFRGKDERLYAYAVAESARKKYDFMIFGHFHDGVDMTLPDGGRFVVLKDWIDGGSPCAVFDSATSSFSLNFPASRS